MGQRNGTRFTSVAAFLLAFGLAAYANAQTGLRGDYYNNPSTSGASPPPPPGSPAGTTFTGAPALTRTDLTVNFGFANPPGPGVNVDHFMVAWTGFVNITTAGTYTFQVRIDDGARLWIDGTLRIDSWSDKGPTDVLSAPFTLSSGQHVLRLEFYENGGGEECRLSYSGPDTANAMVIVPQSVLSLPAPPPAPTNLAATGNFDPNTGAASISLTWNPAATAASYVVLRSTTMGGPYTQIASGVTATSYTDNTIALDVQYCYVVRAVNAYGTSGNSNEDCDLVMTPPPRTNDHEEGIFGTDCGCGSVGKPRPGFLALAGALLAGAFAGRRKFKLERST